MPFRISFPCGVILRTWRIVKMNCGGMAAHGGSAAGGEFPPSSKRASDIGCAMLSRVHGAGTADVARAGVRRALGCDGRLGGGLRRREARARRDVAARGRR